MTTAERVKHLIVNQMQTQKKFAENIGISPPRLNNYLVGVSKIPQDILVRIAEIYDCNLTWLLTGQGPMYIKERAREGVEKTVRIPVVESIAAGAPIEVTEVGKAEIEMPLSLLHLPPPYYAFKVEGESMSPLIQDGDLVVLSRDWRGIELNGRICGFRTPDGITLKKLVLKPRQKTAWLMPINHEYEPVPYSRDTSDLTLIGVLVVSIRKYN